MKSVYTTPTLADAYMVRDLLHAEGIPASIRNEQLVGLAGGVPVNEDRPSVYVADGDVARGSGSAAW